MTSEPTDTKSAYTKLAKFLHLGLAAFGIAAFATGELAEDGFASLGYLLHAYLGLSLTAFILVRVGSGLANVQGVSFRDWSFFSAAQWKRVLDDIKQLLLMKLPSRDKHQGLAGTVQAFGLFIFLWMGVTGTGLYIIGQETEVFEILEELHELGESLIPAYLLLHVGAVVMHSLAGRPVWGRMFKFKG